MKTLRWPNILDFIKNGNPEPEYKIHKKNEEWMTLLSDEVFKVTRLKGTERPFSSELCSLFQPGQYNCVCCQTPLFNSEEKFESHSGWPSFTQPISVSAVAYTSDKTHGMNRVEVTCNTCEAHLGHVFPDGPPPSGLRYCINAFALSKQN